MKKYKHGGKRKVSGNVPKYKHETVTVAFRVPINILPEVKRVVKKMCKKEELSKDQREEIKRKRKE